MRGVAILLLVISHGWYNYLPSGKVGVDIFFVISGYLISGIIFRERAKGEYTIWKFYARRIRRLVPALVFFLGYMIYLLPHTYFNTNRPRMRQEGSHIMASILMAENLEHIRMDFNN
jgi:peptidoglycan/LPS O-acetylase OafA/YrhL